MILRCLDSNIETVIEDLGKGRIAKLIVSPLNIKSDYPEERYNMEVLYYQDLPWHQSLKDKVTLFINENGNTITNVMNAMKTFRDKLLSGKVEDYSLTFDASKTNLERPEFSLSYTFIEPRYDKNKPILLLKDKEEKVDKLPQEQRTTEQLLAEIKAKLGEEKLQSTTMIFRKYGSGRSKKQKRLTVEEIVEEIRYLIEN